MSAAKDLEQELARDLGAFCADPLGFVLYAFAWGQGELAEHHGPDEWQRELLHDLGQGC